MPEPSSVLAYAIGEGVLQDYAEAVMWYRKAAKQGYANAQNHLGWMYRNGRGVEQDLEAVKWFQKAAEQGEAYAQNDPGNDKDKDVERLCGCGHVVSAAEQGEAYAQNSRWIYEYGNEQDYVSSGITKPPNKGLPRITLAGCIKLAEVSSRMI